MPTRFDQDKYTPTTTQTLLYSDFLTNLDVSPDFHDLFIKKNEDSVTMALRNLIKTNKYERPFNPTFGSNLKKYLFEPITPATQLGIQEELTSIITNFEPRVKLINVLVTPYIDDNAYVITINYYLVNKTQPQTLSTILYRVR